MRLIDADALIEFCAERWIPLNIDAVNMQPTIQPEKAQLSQEGATSDLISRTETVEHLHRVLDATVPITDYDEGYADGVEFGISTVSTMPTAQHERKHGKWLADNRPGGGFWVCSCCKFPSEAFAADVLYKFCPNCGADMRGGQDG